MKPNHFIFSFLLLMLFGWQQGLSQLPEGYYDRIDITGSSCSQAGTLTLIFQTYDRKDSYRAGTTPYTQRGDNVHINAKGTETRFQISISEGVTPKIVGEKIAATVLRTADVLQHFPNEVSAEEYRLSFFNTINQMKIFVEVEGVEGLKFGTLNSGGGASGQMSGDASEDQMDEGVGKMRSLAKSSFTNRRIKTIFRGNDSFERKESEIPRGKGRVYIITRDPTGRINNEYAQIYQNEKSITYTNISADLPPGIYKLKINLGAEPVFKTVQVRAGQETHLEAGGYGRISWKTFDGVGKETHEYARIYRDGKSITYTSEYADLPPGTYKLEINLGAEPVFKTVQVRTGQETHIEAGGYGRISWKTFDGVGKESHEYAQIYRDGKSITYTSEYADLPPGTYKLEINLGAEPVFKTVQVRAGQETHLEVGGYGRVSWKTYDGAGKETSEHAQIYRNGKSITYTSEYADLPPGTYDLKFSFEEPVWRRGVQIRPYQEQLITVSGD